MVTHYNEAARSSGLTTEQAHAVVGDLICPEEPAAELSGPEFYNFDVAAIGLGFHHFEDPPLAVKSNTRRTQGALPRPNSGRRSVRRAHDLQSIDNPPRH